METLKARVEKGCLVMDELADLPEGTTLELVPTRDWDELGDEERAELHAALDHSVRQIGDGLGIPWEKIRDEIKSGR